MRPWRVTTTLAGALIIAAACGGGDDAGTADTAAVTEAVSDDGDTDEETATEDTTTTTEAPEPEALPPVIDGLDPIVLLTPESGGGERPLLEWETVPGAERYMVVVYDADGLASWSSVTDATSIYVGGPLPIPSGNSGPRIAEGSTWVVYADDADGRPIAASGRAPIAP